MHRTNVYLTEEQEQALDARAREEGTARSAVLRALIDRGLAEPSSSDPELADAFGELADRYDQLTDGLFDADPDLRIDR